jgi:hypothetical protein
MRKEERDLLVGPWASGHRDGGRVAPIGSKDPAVAAGQHQQVGCDLFAVLLRKGLHGR